MNRTSGTIISRPLFPSSRKMLSLNLYGLALTFPAVILLAFVLALGFLLVILSCALWGNWLPLFVALTFVLAPLPNAICSRRGVDDFASEGSSTYTDFGRFITGMLVVSLVHTFKYRNRIYAKASDNGTIITVTSRSFGANSAGGVLDVYGWRSFSVWDNNGVFGLVRWWR